MVSINCFKKKDDEELLVRHSVTKKAKKLKEVDNYHIQLHLYNRLKHIYMRAIPIYNILYEYSQDGFRVYNTNGGCFYFSSAIILAMNPNDLLVNGNLAPEHPSGFEHQWVEFCFNDKWYVLDSTLAHVYKREDYYSIFKLTINFKKSNEELMRDDFVAKHAQIMKMPQCSHDLNLFYYYRGERMEELKSNLYQNVELDEKGYVKSYNM